MTEKTTKEIREEWDGILSPLRNPAMVAKIYTRHYEFLNDNGHKVKSDPNIHSFMLCHNCHQEFHYSRPFKKCDHGKSHRKRLERKQKAALIGRTKTRIWSALSPEERKTEMALTLLLDPRDE